MTLYLLRGGGPQPFLAHPHSDPICLYSPFFSSGFGYVAFSGVDTAALGSGTGLQAWIPLPLGAGPAWGMDAASFGGGAGPAARGYRPQWFGTGASPNMPRHLFFEIALWCGITNKEKEDESLGWRQMLGAGQEIKEV